MIYHNIYSEYGSQYYLSLRLYSYIYTQTYVLCTEVPRMATPQINACFVTSEKCEYLNL